MHAITGQWAEVIHPYLMATYRSFAPNQNGNFPAGGRNTSVAGTPSSPVVPATEAHGNGSPLNVAALEASPVGAAIAAAAAQHIEHQQVVSTTSTTGNTASSSSSSTRHFYEKNHCRSVQMLGFDLLLDTDFKMHLIEVNSGPSLNMEDAIPIDALSPEFAATMAKLRAQVKNSSSSSSSNTQKTDNAASSTCLPCDSPNQLTGKDEPVVEPPLLQLPSATEDGCIT
eukprot:GSA25T00009841001.1